MAKALHRAPRRLPTAPMLTGLIFATEEADDQPGVLAATLPFGGMTLLEYQARLLVAAGVGQVLVAVGRVTPALLGATSRVGRRIAVDIVRSAEEAAGKAHPLATVLVLADGLFTSEAIVTAMAREPTDALLVTPDGSMPSAVERVGGGQCWAGVATIAAKRLGDAGELPREYDFQSSLLRVVAQAGAAHVTLPAGATRGGHGVERSAAALSARSNDVIRALADRRTAWIDRFFFTPLTRLLLPPLVRRGAPGWAVAAISGLAGGAGTVATALGHPAIGLPLAVAGAAGLSTGALLGWLRGEDDAGIRHERLIGLLAAGAAGGVAFGDAAITMSIVAPLLAAMLVAVQLIAARVPGPTRPWHATPASHLVLLAVAGVAGAPVAGLGLALLHAVATLASAVEAIRADA